VLIIFQAHYIVIVIIILLRAEITLFTAAAALDLTGAAAILVLVLCNDSFAADKTRHKEILHNRGFSIEKKLID